MTVRRVVGIAASALPALLGAQGGTTSSMRAIPVRFPAAATVPAYDAAQVVIQDSPSKDETTFSGRISAFALANGYVVVIAYGPPALREFDGRGTYVRSLGKPGQGPGEFESLSWLTQHHDSVGVNDAGQRRISWFVDGWFVRQQLVAAPGEADNMPASAIGMIDGSAIIMSQLLRGPLNEGLGRARHRILVVTGGTKRAIAGEFDGNESFLRKMGATSVGISRPPIGRQMVTAVGRAIFAVGDTDTGAITVFDRSATPVARFTVEETSRRITSADLQSRLDRLFGARPPATRATWEAQQREMVSTTQLPAFEALFFDDADNLWIGRYDRTQRGRPQWMAVSAAGTVSTNATLPPRCTAQGVRSRVLIAVCLDDDDRPSVALHRLK